MAETNEIEADEGPADAAEEDAAEEAPQDDGGEHGVRTVSVDTRYRNRTQSGFKEFLTRPVAVTIAGHPPGRCDHHP